MNTEAIPAQGPVDVTVRIAAIEEDNARLRELLSCAGDKVIELSELLTRATKQIEKWQEKYGEWSPEWLPPAGDIRLAEDAELAMTKVVKTCMNCGTSGCDHKDARRCSNGRSLWTPNA